MESPRIQRALVSVSDKLGLADFARGLVAAGVEIYSTGGTRKHLESEGVAVRDVADYTGWPEMMDGRLKTLHPKVHGGILCRHDNPEDMRSAAEHGILTFELVVVNLYPFEATVARPGVTLPEAVEQIDIGGPTLVRAAAKNHAFTTIATDARQYSTILDQVAAHGCTTLDLRRQLAGEAFAHTAAYDRVIADYFAVAVAGAEGPFPGALHLSLKCKGVLRYGENPHQQAALYGDARPAGANLVTARQLHGKELSYNNLLDLDGALAIVPRFRPARGRRHQTQQPLRRRRGRPAGRRAAPGHGRRSVQRLRFRAGAEPPRRCRHGRGVGRSGPVRRGHRRPRLRAATPWKSSPPSRSGRTTSG